MRHAPALLTQKRVGGVGDGGPDSQDHIHTGAGLRRARSKRATLTSLRGAAGEARPGSPPRLHPRLLIHIRLRVGHTNPYPGSRQQAADTRQSSSRVGRSRHTPSGIPPTVAGAPPPLARPPWHPLQVYPLHAHPRVRTRTRTRSRTRTRTHNPNPHPRPTPTPTPNPTPIRVRSPLRPAR